MDLVKYSKIKQNTKIKGKSIINRKINNNKNGGNNL